MDGKNAAAAILTILLVIVGVMLATVIMSRSGDLLAMVEAPERRAAGV